MENAVVSCLFYPSLEFSVIYYKNGVKQCFKQEVYKQRARRLPLRRANSVVTLSMSTSLCLWMSILLKNSISRLSWYFIRALQSLHSAETTLSSASWHRICQQCYQSNINSGIELRVAMIKGLNQSLWLHITIHSTPLLLPCFELGFEFALRDGHDTAEVAVDIINGSFC